MVVTLLCSVAGGMLVLLATANVRLLAWRFLRILAAICLAVLAGVAAFRLRAADGPNASLSGIIVAAVATILLVFLAQTADRRAGLFRAISLVAGLAAITASSIEAIAQQGAPGAAFAGAMIVAGQVLASLFLGAITISWLLGHAYLTATRMTIAPLRHFTNILTWLVGLRIVFLLLSVGISLLAVTGSPGPDIVRLMSAAWIIVFLRVIVGLFLVAVFVWMVRDCVRLRSTQSATGILYFGSLFAYVGELAGQQLLHEWGWPM